MSVDVAPGDQAGARDARLRGGVRELGPALAVGYGDRQACSRHAGEEDGRALLDADESETRLELLRPVANEARPVLGPRDQVLQDRDHLAAVADAEGEAVRVREEGAEIVP